MASGKLFGSENFDPKFILTQIWLLQSFYYFITLILTVLLNKFFGLRSDLSQIFSDEPLSVQDSYSLVFILSGAISLPFLCMAIIYVVERTHKVLDFTLTIYVIHLIFVTFYSGFPTRLIWWGLNAFLISVIVLLSEYICMKIEQKEIILTFSNNKNS